MRESASQSFALLNIYIFHLIRHVLVKSTLKFPYRFICSFRHEIIREKYDP
jgi:hypothetical protein